MTKHDGSDRASGRRSSPTTTAGRTVGVGTTRRTATQAAGLDSREHRRHACGGQKTDAADRVVRLLPALRDEPLAHKLAVANAKPDALVCCTATGEAIPPGNVRRRGLGRAVERPTSG